MHSSVYIWRNEIPPSKLVNPQVKHLAEETVSMLKPSEQSPLRKITINKDVIVLGDVAIEIRNKMKINKKSSHNSTYQNSRKGKGTNQIEFKSNGKEKGRTIEIEIKR